MCGRISAARMAGSKVTLGSGDSSANDWWLRSELSAKQVNVRNQQQRESMSESIPSGIVFGEPPQSGERHELSYHGSKPDAQAKTWLPSGFACASGRWVSYFLPVAQVATFGRGGRRAESPLRNKAVSLILTIHHATNHSIPLRGCSGRDDSHDISYRRSGHATDEYGRWIGPWLSQSTPTEPRPIQRTAVVRPTPDFQEERVCVEHCWLCC